MGWGVTRAERRSAWTAGGGRPHTTSAHHFNCVRRISVRGTRREAARCIQEAFGPFTSGQSVQVGIARHHIFRDDQVAFLKTPRASKHGARGRNRFIPERNA